MGYNMKREFLYIHRELVKKLIELADTNGEIAFRCEDPEEATAVRFLINNLLASLARWEPDRAYVRKRLRTWISYNTQEQCEMVHTGVPLGNMKGRKPSTDYMALQGPATAAQQQTTITARKIDFPIDSRAAFKELHYQLMYARGKGEQSIIISNPPSEATELDFVLGAAEELGYRTTDKHASPLTLTLSGADNGTGEGEEGVTT